MAVSLRLYVGGLPSDITKQELLERFGRFVNAAANCHLEDVELPMPKPLGAIVLSRGFAYLTLQGTDAALQSEKLQKTFHRTKWRGSMLKVQLAKPHYKLQLEAEWAQMKAMRAANKCNKPLVADADTIQPLNVALPFQGRKTTEFDEVEEVAQNENILYEEDVEAYVRQVEQDMPRAVETMAKLTKEEVNARRLAAIEAKQQRKLADKAVLGNFKIGHGNTKKVWSDASDTDHEGKSDGAVVSNWLDSSDDEVDVEGKTYTFMNPEEVDAAFAIRPELMGEKGKQLFEMQKRFQGDARFRFDARFVEDDADEFKGNDEVDAEQSDGLTALSAELKVVEDDMEYALEMQEDDATVARVVATLFPGLDVTRRLDKQLGGKDPLKEAAWMGQLQRYDPRDVHACHEFEVAMTNNVVKDDATTTGRRDDYPTGGDRFFSTTGALSTLFSRVRANSEDGEAGEAALDGVVGRSLAAGATDGTNGFKLSSLFAFPEGEDEALLSTKSEDVIEDEANENQPRMGDWELSQRVWEDHDEDAMATDSEGGDEIEEDGKGQADEMKTRTRKSMEDFLAFGRTFAGTGDDIADWPERRKKLTLDYKRKRRDAIKMKKRTIKQQLKRKTDGTTGIGSTERKKARELRSAAEMKECAAEDYSTAADTLSLSRGGRQLLRLPVAVIADAGTRERSSH
ncbi:hypothetical protein CCR75_007705 [Bremia lactucae]|uniref:RRM domain-containing protein n=1 Tax=Bremia lactucae TaxID=4779 RepID=A0A976FMT4_BRELC|nr:hypothetical protein CCR75_007705 [Bremia lactucae]